MPLVLITDANVWIDLYLGDVLSHAARTENVIVIPDIVHRELLRSQQVLHEEVRLLIDLGNVKLGTLDGSGVEIALALGRKYTRPQRPDLFALTLAKTENAVLITGDRRLRDAAERESVNVHGTLWFMEQLVAENLISKQGASDALQKMLGSGRRLPKAECSDLIRRWGMS